ncbi:DUF4157 domain-containing protein [Mucilaginibacter sp.]|uniref:eCIS core domain-containing protein n=1 Tax=Mucilaginibacter sp. TaxID=1882438 RepID=UPI00260CE80E|nr:DUF4157 domain-containing protein [Mucilaginibacter sp.]MDB4923272.1 hypothetical protein [Mucilaginibacter sp.]
MPTHATAPKLEGQKKADIQGASSVIRETERGKDPVKLLKYLPVKPSAAHSVNANSATNFGRIPLFNSPSHHLQTKLIVNRPGDQFEREADAMAEHILLKDARPTSFLKSVNPAIRRKCSHCEEEEKEQQVQRKESKAGHPEVSDSMHSYLNGLNNAGMPLPQQVRGYFEPKFGYDFSKVRVHTDNEAARSAHSINALAYTTANNIVFNSGQYSPQTIEGKRLLGHELTHVIQQQQGRMIQRAPDNKPAPPVSGASKDEDEAKDLEKEILGMSEFTSLDPKPKAEGMEIITRAKTKPLGSSKGQRNYYLKKLKIALTTPFNGVKPTGGGYGCSPVLEKKNRAIVGAALKTEEKWGGAYSDVDEKAVAKGTKAVKRTGEQGKIYTVDRSDPRNILVKIKVHLNGKKDEVDKIKALEDAIERAVSIGTKGYHLDIEFVDKSGPDVFEFDVNFCEWPNSGNWASSPDTLSHEVHHALGLGDRYDYIESHSKNPDMPVNMRLHWFLEQMKKTGGARDPFSKMATSSNSLLAEDVCKVAFESAADQKKCIDARKDLDPAGVPPI